MLILSMSKLSLSSLFLLVALNAFAFTGSAAHADISGTSADAYVNGDVNIDNQGDARIAVGSAVGNIGSGVHASASMDGLDVANSGMLELAVGSVVGDGFGTVSNVSTSARVGHLRINNGGHLKLAIGSVAP